MRFSLWPTTRQPWHELLDAAQHAEQTGWDGIWIADHFMSNDDSDPYAPVLEASSVVAALAGVVGRVRIGSLVLGAGYRHPAVVANMAATVDQISGGRFVLGLGTGWQQNEHEQYGFDLLLAARRIDRFEESVRIIRSLLTERRTTVHGHYYEVVGAVCEPKPVQERLPILIGAEGEQRMLRVVAALADEWNCWGLPGRIDRKGRLIDAYCTEFQRDSAEVKRSAQALLYVDEWTDSPAAKASNAPMPAIGGTTQQVIDELGRFRDIGVDEFIVPDFTLGSGAARRDAMDHLVEAIIPAVR